MKTRIIGSFIGMVIANFTFQLFTSNNWMLACDRTFFQALACGLCYYSYLCEINSKN